MASRQIQGLVMERLLTFMKVSAQLTNIIAAVNSFMQGWFWW